MLGIPPRVVRGLGETAYHRIRQVLVNFKGGIDMAINAMAFKPKAHPYDFIVHAFRAAFKRITNDSYSG